MNAAVMQQNAVAQKKEYWRWEETAWVAPDKDWRAARILSCGIDVEREFFITGGIAKNPGVVKRIERIIGIEALKTEYDSQIAGALGAALFGYTLVQKGQAKQG